MDKDFLFVGGVFWLTCTAYVLYYFNKHYKVNFETICFAILLGPVIALIMKDPAEEELKSQQELKDFWEDVRRRFESEDNTIPNFRRTPPPPPKKQNTLKDFKFFR